MQPLMATSATFDRASSDRSFPTAPLVGIGAVVLRRGPQSAEKEVLLIKRAKPPNVGWWSFPGGGLELGERIVDCAVREVLEETGIVLADCGAEPNGLYGRRPCSLASPVPFAAADVIHPPDAPPEFHYAIIEVAATPVDPGAEPQPRSDVSDAKWFTVDSLPSLEKLTVNCASIAKEAALRFDPP